MEMENQRSTMNSKRSSSDSVPMMTCSEEMAAKYAKVLVGCYRRGEAEDAPVYARALIALLKTYPENAVRSVTDPRSGLPTKIKFLPTIYEVKEACEAQIAPLLAAEARRRRMDEAETDRPAEISEAAAARRKAFIADWRLRVAAEHSADDDGEVKLHEMDVRKCQGEMRGMVAKALNANLERLSAECAASPLRLSDAALATAAGHAPLVFQAEDVAS